MPRKVYPERDKVIELYKAGLGISAIERKVGLDRSIVRRILRYASVPMRPKADLTSEQRRLICDLYRAGSTMAEVGRQTGFDFSAIRYALEKADVPRRPHGIYGRTLVGYWNPYEIGYLAGLIDGEGTIQFKHGKAFWIQIVNTYAPLLPYLEQLLAPYKGHWTRPGTLGTKPVFVIKVSRAFDISILLKKIRPYLIVKAAAADGALAELASRFCVE